MGRQMFSYAKLLCEGPSNATLKTRERFFCLVILYADVSANHVCSKLSLLTFSVLFYKQIKTLLVNHRNNLLVCHSPPKRYLAQTEIIHLLSFLARGFGSEVKHSTSDTGIASLIPLTPT